MSASSKKKLRKEQNAAQLTEKQRQEQKEAKKLKTYTRVFVIIMVAVFAFGILGFAGSAILSTGILERNVDAVKIGDRVLTNAQLNYYYVDTINATYGEWYEEYQDNLTIMLLLNERLNPNTPLNEQPHPTDSSRTYADFFVDKAILQARRAYALNDMAGAENFKLSEDELTEIDDLMSSMENLSKLYGHPNFTSYLKAMYGRGANPETYREYLTVTRLAESFQNDYRDSLKYTDADLKAHSDSHFDEFSSFHFRYFYMEGHDFMDHAEGDDSHNHSEADEQAALKKAEAAAKAIADKKTATAEEFEAAIKAIEGYADKDALKSTERKFILYTDINADLAKWLAESGRKEGDLGMIPYSVTSTDADGKETSTVQGYFVIMYVDRDDNNAKMVDVRHILAKFQGGTKNDEGVTVYSDAEKKAALDRITEIQNTWLQGEKVDESSFAKLATSKTEDNASSSSGGLYTDVHPHEMVDAFNDWCFDESRKAGDYGIVETEYGYHLIYFVKTNDTTYRNHMIESTLRNEAFNAWYDKLADKVSCTTLDTSKLSLDLIIGG